LVRAPDQEPYDFVVLRIAGEDCGRILWLDRAQDQAGGFETVRQHEISRARTMTTTLEKLGVGRFGGIEKTSLTSLTSEERGRGHTWGER
jgi:hypothetical protein